MGVKTITLTENKGALAGALVVREHEELVFISQNGMVQRTSVRGINRYGRASQGVRVMNIREDDQVSAVALVVESETATGRRWRRNSRSAPGRARWPSTAPRPTRPVDRTTPICRLTPTSWTTPTRWTRPMRGTRPARGTTPTPLSLPTTPTSE